MKETEWEWPCEKRRAHGPHYTRCLDHPEEQGITGPFKPCSNCQQCPGVKAHPLTQIGKGELKPKLSK